MSELAERIKYLCDQANDAGNPHAGAYIRDLGDLVSEHAPTILAGLAAIEERDRLRALHDAVQKYMQHKNNTQPKIDSGQMDVRMIYRQDVLDALAALQPTPEEPK